MQDKWGLKKNEPTQCCGPSMLTLPTPGLLHSEKLLLMQSGLACQPLRDVGATITALGPSKDALYPVMPPVEPALLWQC